MKTLRDVKPTPEQLKLITLLRPGTRVIRGSAGSGKTTTSILMLKTALGYLLDYRREQTQTSPIRVKVFSFNKTLAAYIKDLVTETSTQIGATPGELELDVATLSSYLYKKKPLNKEMITTDGKFKVINSLMVGIDLQRQFILDEIEYLLGRVDLNNVDEYLSIDRAGRGTKPRLTQAHRQGILEKIIKPYIKHKEKFNLIDWNDLAFYASKTKFDDFDVVIIDEAQDFSANQLKAILNQLTSECFTTIVLDSAQKIYKRGFTWKELGVKNPTYFRLDRNYRNTFEIPNFAVQLLNNSGVDFDDDATLPVLSAIERHGPLPIVIQGKFSKQLSEALKYINENVDLSVSSVCFLHPKGGGWFDFVETKLNDASIDFVSISRADKWPSSDINVALSTIHSAKGLEFDYVIMLGIEDSHFLFEEVDCEDSNYVSSIKLISMAITRAKENVILGYKEHTKPRFIDYLEKGTYEGRGIND
jgi:DNA helicase IV